MVDIFEFWSDIGRGETVHPADKSVLKRMNPKKHGFRTDCLPASYVGRLRDAPVVLLYLSPGFDEQDLKEAISDEGKDYYVRRWTGNEPLPDIGISGHNWLKSRTKYFTDYKIAKDSIAVLNIGAYHSINVNSYSSMLALPSSRASLDWAQRTLFPDAESGKRIVICMRSAAYWGLETGRIYGKSLFTPEVTRKGYLVYNDKNQKIKDMVYKSLNT